MGFIGSYVGGRMAGAHNRRVARQERYLRQRSKEMANTPTNWGEIGALVVFGIVYFAIFDAIATFFGMGFNIVVETGDGAALIYIAVLILTPIVLAFIGMVAVFLIREHMKDKRWEREREYAALKEAGLLPDPKPVVDENPWTFSIM